MIDPATAGSVLAREWGFERGAVRYKALIWCGVMPTQKNLDRRAKGPFRGTERRPGPERRANTRFIPGPKS